MREVKRLCGGFGGGGGVGVAGRQGKGGTFSSANYVVLLLFWSNFDNANY